MNIVKGLRLFNRIALTGLAQRLRLDAQLRIALSGALKIVRSVIRHSVIFDRKFYKISLYFITIQANVIYIFFLLMMKDDDHSIASRVDASRKT